MKNPKARTVRAGTNLFQEKLAKLAGVTRQTIGMVETGEYNPTLDLCVVIRRALCKTLGELFWEEQQEI